MNSQQLDVLRFMQKHGQKINPVPSFPNGETIVLRIRLLEEELAELKTAMIALEDCDDDASEDVYFEMLTEVADGLEDLNYVTQGTALSFGIDLDRVHDVVHSNNMMKPEGTLDTDGKVLKQKHHLPPTDAINKVLRGQKSLFSV